MRERGAAEVLIGAWIAAGVVTSWFDVARAAEECHAAPKGPAPAGEHWYYRTDRSTGRKCWFLGPRKDAANTVPRAAGQAQPEAQAQAQAQTQTQSQAQATSPADGGDDAAAGPTLLQRLLTPPGSAPEAAPAAAPAPAADDGCAAAPHGPAPEGQHWFYRTDRESGRKCWFLAPRERQAQRTASSAATVQVDAEQNVMEQGAAGQDAAEGTELQSASADDVRPETAPRAVTSGAPRWRLETPGEAAAAAVPWPDPLRNDAADPAPAAPDHQAAAAALDGRGSDPARGNGSTIASDPANGAASDTASHAGDAPARAAGDAGATDVLERMLMPMLMLLLGVLTLALAGLLAWAAHDQIAARRRRMRAAPPAAARDAAPAPGQAPAILPPIRLASEHDDLEAALARLQARRTRRRA